MKKFKYIGSGTLSFSIQGIEYSITKGLIYSLPLLSELVNSLAAQGLLVEV